MCDPGRRVRFYSGALQGTEKLETPVFTVDARYARQLRLQLVRDMIPYKTTALGSNITLFVRTTEAECAWLTAFKGAPGDKREVFRKLRAAAISARECINHHGITGDMASAELDEAIEVSKRFV